MKKYITVLFAYDYRANSAYKKYRIWKKPGEVVILLRVSGADIVSRWCSPQIEVVIKTAFLIRSSPMSKLCPSFSNSFYFLAVWLCIEPVGAKGKDSTGN